jgi:hypothetical protein
VNLAGVLAEARLRPHGKLTVVITKPEAVGKAFEFVVHPGGRILTQVSCRAPASLTQTHPC